jgi:hypothetical protein
MSSKTSKAVASVVLWLAVFGTLLVGNFTFTSGERPLKTALGGALLMVAFAVTVLVWWRRPAGASNRDPGALN